MFLMATTAWAWAPFATALGAASRRTRANEAKIQAPYPDSAQGLKQELRDMRAMARSHRSDKLRAMITDLEIQNARAWFLANLGTPGLKTADNYEKTLRTSEDADREPDDRVC
jgi:hypothetical protein